MLRLQVVLFLEELASVLLTPFMLYYTLPDCAGEQCGPPHQPTRQRLMCVAATALQRR